MNAAIVSSAVSNVKRVRKAWGGKPPLWIMVLAEQCDKLGSQGKAAAKIKYSEASISQVIGNKYKGDLKKVQMAVQGAFMSGTVMCPVMKEISSETCISIQSKKRQGSGHFQQRLEKACRNGCPNFISPGDKHDEER